MKTTILALFVCLTAVCSQAQRTSGSNAERELVLLEHVSMLQACQNKDVKILDSILNDGFVYVDPDGKYYTKADFLSLVKSADFLQYVKEGMVVRQHGNAAIVTGSFRSRLVLHSKPSLSQGRFVDTWLFENGRWMCIASLDTPGE